MTQDIRKQCSFRHEPSTYFRSDRQRRLVHRVVARGHHFRIEGHPAHGVSERLGHEREYRRVVVAEVVAPAERVVDTSSVGTWNFPFVIPKVAAEQVDLLLRLAAVLPCQQTAGWNSDSV